MARASSGVFNICKTFELCSVVSCILQEAGRLPLDELKCQRGVPPREEHDSDAIKRGPERRHTESVCVVQRQEFYAHGQNVGVVRLIALS